MNYWQIIADKLSKAGWSWGCVATLNSSGQTIFVSDAHRDNGQRYIVHEDEKLTAFLELEAAIRAKHGTALTTAFLRSADFLEKIKKIASAFDLF